MLQNFFSPSSIAIIGASKTPGKIGNDMLKNLYSFAGEKYGVNPKNGGSTIYGIDIFESIKSLPTVPDVAIIVIPQQYVLSAVQECAKKGIKNVVIISAGYKESGNIKAEKELIKSAKENNIRILGPNCLGFLNPHINLNASFACGSNIKKGKIALVSQSGAMAVAMMDWAERFDIGFSTIISMGNKADITENDLLEMLEKDNNSEVIVFYLESIIDGRKFYELAKKASRKKPIVMVKSGVSEKGSLAASSHTGALSGTKEVLETALLQAGVHSTHSIKELFLWSHAFSQTKEKTIPEEILIITNAGGPGVMAVDNAEKFGVTLFTPNKKEIEILSTNMPSAASSKNPMDILGDADSGRYKQALKNVSTLQKNRSSTKKSVGILILLTPQTVTDTENIAEEIIAFQRNNPKMLVVTSFMGGKSVAKARKILEKNGIIHCDYPADALQIIRKLQDQKKTENSPEKKIPFQYTNNSYPKAEDKEIELLGPQETSNLLEKYNIPFAKETLITEISKISQIPHLEYPAVMKISSPDIAHKTDIGGVVMDIKSTEEAEKAFVSIIESAKEHAPNARINGVVHQRQFPKSKEVFIGMKRDPTFGDIIIFGLGGIYLNVLEDVSRRLLPISVSEIHTMISEIQSYPILAGTRGEKSIDFDALANTILRLSQLFIEHTEIREIDINPLFCMEQESSVMDAKIFV